MTTQSKRGKSLNLVMGGVFVVFAIVIVAVVMPKMSSSSTGSSGSSSSVPPGVIIGVLAVLALLVLMTLLRTRRGMNRIAAGAVQTTEGPAKTKARAYADDNQMSTMPIYRLTVGQVTFALSGSQQLDAFEDGATYRCYYLEGTLPILVSAERI